MNDALIVRPPEPADHEAWARMIFAIYRDDEEFSIDNLAAARAAARACCHGGQAADLLLTAFLDERPLGLVQANRHDRRVGGRGWYITAVGVEPDARRRGIGTALLAALCEQTAPEAVIAAVRNDNPAGLALFARGGFRRSKDRAGFPDGVVVFVHESSRARRSTA